MKQAYGQTEAKRRRAKKNTDKCLEGKVLTVNNNKNVAYLNGMAGPQLVDPETGKGLNEKQ
jgi:hypothetical protein